MHFLSIFGHSSINNIAPFQTGRALTLRKYNDDDEDYSTEDEIDDEGSEGEHNLSTSVLPMSSPTYARAKGVEAMTVPGKRLDACLFVFGPCTKTIANFYAILTGSDTTGSEYKEKPALDYWNDSQAFSKLEMDFIVPSEDTAWGNFTKALTERGLTTTGQQSQYIPLSQKGVLVELCEHLNSPTLKESIDQVSTRNFFLEKNRLLDATGIRRQNGNKIGKALCSFVNAEGKGEMRKLLLPVEYTLYKKQGPYTQADVNKELRREMDNTASMYSADLQSFLLQKNRPVDRLCHPWNMHNVVFKAATLVPEVIKSYSDMFQNLDEIPDFPQRYFSRTTISTAVWLRTFLFPAHYYASEVLNSDMMIEELVYKRLMADHPPHDKDFDNIFDFHNATKMENLRKVHNKIDKDIKDLRDQQAKRGKEKPFKEIEVMGSTFTNVLSSPQSLCTELSEKKTLNSQGDFFKRLQAYFSAVILKDMIDTVKEYGIDPELDFDKNKDTYGKTKSHLKTYLDW